MQKEAKCKLWLLGLLLGLGLWFWLLSGCCTLKGALQDTAWVVTKLAENVDPND